MTDQNVDLTEPLIELGVGIAIGIAGMQMSDGVDDEMVNAIRMLWPDELSADALTIGSQVALAIVAWINSQPHEINLVHGGDLLEFSQTLIPTTTDESE